MSAEIKMPRARSRKPQTDPKTMGSLHREERGSTPLQGQRFPKLRLQFPDPGLTTHATAPMHLQTEPAGLLQFSCSSGGRDRREPPLEPVDAKRRKISLQNIMRRLAACLHSPTKLVCHRPSQHAHSARGAHGKHSSSGERIRDPGLVIPPQRIRDGWIDCTAPPAAPVPGLSRGGLTITDMH